MILCHQMWGWQHLIMCYMWFNKYICPMFESFDVNLTFKMLGGHLLIMLTHVWVACCFPVFSHLVRSGKYSLSGWQSGTGDKLIHTVCWWSVVQILSYWMFTGAIADCPALSFRFVYLYNKWISKCKTVELGDQLLVLVIYAVCVRLTLFDCL